MSAQELFIQQFARLFHQHREAASRHSALENAPATSATLDDDNRLTAAARLAILELETNALLQDNGRRYFAKPGEAEWGC